MQAQLIDPVGRQFNIETSNPQLIVWWLGEYIPLMDKEWRLRIWLANAEEAKTFGQPYMEDYMWTPEGVRSVINFFRRAEKNLAQKGTGNDQAKSQQAVTEKPKRQNARQNQKSAGKERGMGIRDLPDL